jgi:hypothetical protein
MSNPSPRYEICRIIYCSNCADNRPEDVRFAHWGRLEVGLTDSGFQIWCTRCKLNVFNASADIEEVCSLPGRHENPTPSGKKIPMFGWKNCVKCGLTDRFGPGLFKQEICLVCGTETEEYDEPSSD